MGKPIVLVAVLVLAACARQPQTVMSATEVAAATNECIKLDLRAQAYTDSVTRDVVKVVCLPKRQPFGVRFGKLPRTEE